MKNIQDTMKKAMSTMFQSIENVSYDLATGLTGIKTEGGLVTMGADGTLEQNPMDFFSMEIPAFAMVTPVAEVKVGDLLVSNGKAYAFIIENGMIPADMNADREEAPKRSIRALNWQGHETRFRPKKVSMMGINDGMTVVRSFGNLMGNQNQKGTGGFDMSSMLPFMMMGALGDGKSDMKSMLPLLMMSGGNMGQMNPMMLMMLMGDNSPFK